MSISGIGQLISLNIEIECLPLNRVVDPKSLMRILLWLIGWLHSHKNLQRLFLHTDSLINYNVLITVGKINLIHPFIFGSLTSLLILIFVFDTHSL